MPKLLAVYAFGSRVQGTAGTESDLDLAVLVAGYAEPLAFMGQHIIRREKLGIPQSVRDAFALLAQGGWSAVPLAGSRLAKKHCRTIANNHS